MKISLPAELSSLEKALDYIENALNRHRYKRKQIMEAMMLSEDAIVSLIEHLNLEDQRDDNPPMLDVSIHRRLGYSEIRLSAPGDKIDFSSDELNQLLKKTIDRHSESAIRSILYQAYDNKVSYSQKGRFNQFKVMAGVPEQELAIQSLVALGLAVIFGLLLHHFVPITVQEMLDVNILIPVEDIILKILMLISAPIVFLAIVTSMARFSAFSDPGHVSLKIFWGYGITTVTALFVGIIISNVFSPGQENQFAEFVESFTTSDTFGLRSIFEMITDIVPNNIVDPFGNSSILQLIFLAVVIGLSLGHTGKYEERLKSGFEALNTLCTAVSVRLIRFLPIGVFAAMTSLILNIGISIIVPILQLLGTVCLGFAIMMFIYLIVIWIFARINPIIFLKKYSKTMVESFLLGSGVAAIPKTLRCCQRKLGISSEICMFSIPVGALLNMDGNCIYLTVASLFLAKMCGLNFITTAWIAFMFSIVVLSIGAPVAPGSVLLCLVVLMGQMGVSLSAISILMGINMFVEMLLAMSNCIGDVAITLVVAKSEKLLDMDVYKS